MKHLPTILALILCSQWLTACGSLGDDFCKQGMKCEGGNDADVDACIASAEGSKNRANAYDCGDDFEEVVACWEENATCQGTDPEKYFTSYDPDTGTDPCEGVEDALEACMEKGSSLDD